MNPAAVYNKTAAVKKTQPTVYDCRIQSATVAMSTITNQVGIISGHATTTPRFADSLMRMG